MANRWARSAALAVFAAICASAGIAAAGEPAGGQAVTLPAPIDVSRLPIDLERVYRELRPSTVREERDALNLRYFVDVYGQSPRIELFGPDAPRYARADDAEGVPRACRRLQRPPLVARRAAAEIVLHENHGCAQSGF